MASVEIGLIARANGVATHLLSRPTLETLAEGGDLASFSRGLSRLGTQIEPLGEPFDVFAVERAVGRTAAQHFHTLQRWQHRIPGVLDVFAARQDHRSLRALLRGAAEGAPFEARVNGLLPTPSLPWLALADLGRQASAADVARQLALLAHPQAGRLLSVVVQAQPDLLAIDVALLFGFAERATRVAARSDATAREFVGATIDIGNAQNALLLAAEPVEMNPANVFVPGGHWLSSDEFARVAAASSRETAVTLLSAALADSPLVSLLPLFPNEIALLDRAFVASMLKRLTHAARLAPLGTAPVLRVLLLIEAQTRDLRALAWGAALGAPPSLRKQQLVTPP